MAEELLRGVDVSNHQGTIDWARVARSGIRFAYLKASEGRTFVDAYYARNRAEANRHGIRVGAYHFGRPNSSAVTQARHFVEVAKPAPGDLVPCLDIEVTDGVGVGDLRSWTRTFVEEVRRLTGVKPSIYTSPGFWRGPLGNDRTFGDNPLWIAHWHVQKPSVPGAWQTWSLWQTSASGKVDGIRGDVDMNLAKASRLPLVPGAPAEVEARYEVLVPGVPGAIRRRLLLPAALRRLRVMIRNHGKALIRRSK